MPNKRPNISEQDSFEFNVDPKDSIIVQRQFLGKTQRDIEIEKLPIPSKPIILYFIIKMIRFYQHRISKKLGNRCVFDPSCSHYSEIAFRKKGILKGSFFTIKRLYHCRPKNGGIDELI
ncbi:MAG: membrane protein insertion efficiency factor YidD [Bacteroidota bacterium]